MMLEKLKALLSGERKRDKRVKLTEGFWQAVAKLAVSLAFALGDRQLDANEKKILLQQLKEVWASLEIAKEVE